MVRPIFSILNVNNLKNNFFIIRKLSSNRNIWIVIKGDAYGHGIDNIYNIISNYVDGFAVLSITEALHLRFLGWLKPILLLEGFFDIEEIYLCLKFNIDVVIHSKWQVDLFKKVFFLNKKINIYLKLNSNINRLGFYFNEFKYIYKILNSNNIVKNLSLIFHYTFSTKYKDVFSLKKEVYKILSLNFKNISLTSSLGLINNINDIYSNWYRIGILLYGLSPTGKMSDILNYGFKPVMSFISKIISIKKIKKNQYIGYNNSFYSEIERYIGIVACGYADGYPRQLSNKYYVLVNYKFKAQILGYISMDMMIIDLLDNKNINIGDEVELWGENLYIDNISKIANTISYDLISGINKNRVLYKLK